MFPYVLVLAIRSPHRRAMTVISSVSISTNSRLRNFAWPAIHLMASGGVVPVARVPLRLRPPLHPPAADWRDGGADVRGLDGSA